MKSDTGDVFDPRNQASLVSHAQVPILVLEGEKEAWAPPTPLTRWRTCVTVPVAREAHLFSCYIYIYIYVH